MTVKECLSGLRRKQVAVLLAKEIHGLARGLASFQKSYFYLLKRRGNTFARVLQDDHA